jgi:hypothetical protein
MKKIVETWIVMIAVKVSKTVVKMMFVLVTRLAVRSYCTVRKEKPMKYSSDEECWRLFEKISYVKNF